MYVRHRPKSIGHVQEIKRKESKHNTIESHQHTREESKKIRNREVQKQSENNKMETIT